MLLLGSARTSQYAGRANSVTLLFFNPRTVRASLVSLPPLLYVYIPGYTMQRLNVAFPVGGISRMQQTLAYNFGIQPFWWAVAHLDDFPALIDDLGGLDFQILAPIKAPPCSFNPGQQHLSGAQVLCYSRILPQGDEPARLLRQQEVLRTIFFRLVTGGTLSRLPDLYQKYKGMIQTNFGLTDLTNLVPLALKLGDPGRISYYQVGSAETDPWQLPESQARVLLPRREAIASLLQQAIYDVSVPAPLTERVSTLEAELTVSPTPTITPLPTATLTSTATSTRTPTRTPTRTLTPTITLTPTATSARTSTPTTTSTSTVTATSTATPTPSATPSPTESPTATSVGTPSGP